MKTPKSKVHLLRVDEPLLAYFQLTVQCEIVLRNAIPVFMESDEMPPGTKPSEYPLRLRICHKCLAAAPQSDSDKRTYLYGLMEAEESKHSQEEQEEELEEAVA